MKSSATPSETTPWKAIFEINSELHDRWSRTIVQTTITKKTARMAETTAFIANTASNDNNQASHWHLTFNNPVQGKHYTKTTKKVDVVHIADDSDSDNDDNVVTEETETSFEITLVLPTKEEQKGRGAPVLVDWYVGQMEVGKECGTPHIHLHIKFTRPASFSMVQNILKESAWANAHIAKVMDIKAHLAYVTKEDTRVNGPYRSPGAPKGDVVKGQRTDLMDLKAALDKDKVADVWQNNFGLMIKYFKGASAYLLTKDRPKERPLHEVIVLYGPPGTGKSSLARELLKRAFPDEDPFYKGIGKWFDGYMGEKGMIMDDYDGLGQSIRDVKNILDKVPCRIEVKGGFVNMAQELTIITTNSLPSMWFGDNVKSPYDIPAILRRCTFFNCGLDMYKRVAGGIRINALGVHMRTVIEHELQKIRDGETSVYSGVTGEYKLHQEMQTAEDARGNDAIYVAPPVLPVLAATPENRSPLQNVMPAVRALVGMRRNRVERDGGEPDDGNEQTPARPRMLTYDSTNGGSPIPEEGSARNPIII